jgi:hypothetical protein
MGTDGACGLLFYLPTARPDKYIAWRQEASERKKAREGGVRGWVETLSQEVINNSAAEQQEK